LLNCTSGDEILVSDGILYVTPSVDIPSNFNKEISYITAFLLVPVGFEAPYPDGDFLRE
jgi:hypothetical protein